MAGDTIKFVIEMRDGASKPLKRVGDAVEDAAENAENATTRYTELASKFTLLGIAAKGASKIVSAFAKPLLSVTKGGIAAGAQMEGFETQLTVLMGSSSAAKKRLEELFTIGSTTPFQLPGLIEAETNLRALGVNAEEALPMVMDFAGAMKVDVARAAVEVGRAMQFGAGAVESIAGRSLRAQVEIRTGADALKMSTEEFREALVDTLTDKDGMFAGGTAKLAATFDGMLSNLQDSFFKFQKEVADAGVFSVAKEILQSVLDILGESEAATRRWAQVLAAGIVDSMLVIMKLTGFILESIHGFSKAFTLGGVAIDEMIIRSSKLDRSIKQLILSAGEFTGLMSDESRENLERRIVETYKDQGDARKRIQKTMFEDLEILEQEEIKIRKIREEADRIGRNLDSIVAKTTPSGQAGAKVAAPAKAVETALSKAQEDAGPTAEELEKSMRDALMGTEAALQESLVSLRDLQYKLSPAGLAEGLVNKLTDSFGALTSMMGPAGGLVQSLSIMGQEGAGKITKALKQSIEGLIVGLVDVLPKLIVSIPRAIINAVPDLIEGIFLAIPALAEAILIGLPVAVAKGLARWFRIAIATIEAVFFPKKAEREKRQELRERQRESGTAQGALFAGGGKLAPTLAEFLRLSTRKKHAGVSHVDRTGAFLLQAGEAVIPNSGTTTQGMERRMGGRGGMNVTINTNVVDKNAIRGLGKLLEQEFSSFGRSTSPVFNSPTGTTG